MADALGGVLQQVDSKQVQQLVALTADALPQASQAWDSQYFISAWYQGVHDMWQQQQAAKVEMYVTPMACIAGQDYLIGALKFYPAVPLNCINVAPTANATEDENAKDTTKLTKLLLGTMPSDPTMEISMKPSPLITRSTTGCEVKWNVPFWFVPLKKGDDANMSIFYESLEVHTSTCIPQVAPKGKEKQSKASKTTTIRMAMPVMKSTKKISMGDALMCEWPFPKRSNGPFTTIA